MQGLISKSLKLTALLVILATGVLFIFQKFSWGTGFLLAAGWSIANLFLTARLLEIAILQKSKAKLSRILLLKFPFLYLLGLTILLSKKFPLFSLLAGLSPILIVTGALKLWLRRT
ncbi:MAG: hypothetical protein PHY94_06435 [Candidatus Omnitrophica bacterium]|nr:hypothetical protein [Candidatus Omnitrophota bacterium]